MNTLNNLKDIKNPITGIVLLLVFHGVFFYLNYGDINKLSIILSSFNGFSTLLVGLYAFILYNKQKVDYKSSAANTIIQEIQYSERVLSKYQPFLEEKEPRIVGNEKLLPTTTWGKYKYLFVNDLSFNEWEAISKFYNSCEAFDSAVQISKSYFQKNEALVRENFHRRAAELLWKEFDSKNQSKVPKGKVKQIPKHTLDTLKKNILEQTNSYLQLTPVAEYNPIKPNMDAKNELETIKLNLSLQGAVNKLNLIANKAGY